MLFGKKAGAAEPGRRRRTAPARLIRSREDTQPRQAGRHRMPPLHGILASYSTRYHYCSGHHKAIRRKSYQRIRVRTIQTEILGLKLL